MGTVTELSDYRPHNSGMAKCLGCGHEWMAVAPVSHRTNLECPSCSLFRGEFMGNCAPSDDEPVYQCGCGCELWFVVPSGVFCRGCGNTLAFSELE